jgi:hypothetical protein
MSNVKQGGKQNIHSVQNSYQFNLISPLYKS